MIFIVILKFYLKYFRGPSRSRRVEYFRKISIESRELVKILIRKYTVLVPVPDISDLSPGPEFRKFWIWVAVPVPDFIIYFWEILKNKDLRWFQNLNFLGSSNNFLNNVLALFFKKMHIFFVAPIKKVHQDLNDHELMMSCQPQIKSFKFFGSSSEIFPAVDKSHFRIMK